MNLNELIDEAKSRQECKSYNELAARIGITRGALSQIRNGGSVSEDTLTKIGKLAGVKPEVAHAAYYLSRPVSQETKNMWKRLSGVAASVALCIGITGFGVTHSPTVQASEVPSNVYYVKYSNWNLKTKI